MTSGDDDPSQLARLLAQGISECANTAAMFAAPKVFARWAAQSGDDPTTLKARVLGTIDGLVAALDRGTAGTAGAGRLRLGQMAPVAAALREAVSGWDAAGAPGPELVESARRFIETMGMPEPPGGWDAFDPLA